MAITHDYLNTSGFKPTAGEANTGQLIPNLADGTLWSKNVAGTVIEIGGGSGSIFSPTDYTATHLQTTFSVTYTVGAVRVYLDGIEIRNFTATNGTSIILDAGVSEGTWFRAVAFTTTLLNTVAWSNITSTPTTLSGYGITDAAPIASPTFTGTPVLPATTVIELSTDTTPQLGGDLDVDGNDIVSTTNGDINITPNGTGKTVITNIEAPISINAQTGTTYAPVLADAEKMIACTNAAAITVTIPANSSVAFPIGTKLNFMQGGAGAVTIAITTDTLLVNSNFTLVLNGPYAVATAMKLTATLWVLFGNLVAS